MALKTKDEISIGARAEGGSTGELDKWISRQVDKKSLECVQNGLMEC